MLIWIAHSSGFRDRRHRRAYESDFNEDCVIGHMTRVAIIAGGTGLVGNAVVRDLLEDPEFSRIYAVGRRSLGISHPKLHEISADFENLAQAEFPQGEKGTDAICTLGTTRGKAGSEQAFRNVDLTYVVNFATWAKNLGVQHFAVMSSMGANPQSHTLYMRTKGDMENAIEAIGFGSTIIARPSMLTGPRKERRIAEWIFGRIFFPLIGWALPKRYRAIPSYAVARAIVESLKSSPPGLTVLTSDRLYAFKKAKN